MNNIGTLSEKSIHSQLKHIFEKDTKYHEIKVGRYIADICVDKNIVEVQTCQLYKLLNKLKFYMENGYTITIVYPVVKVNTLHWISLEGEVVSSRKITKNKAIYSILHELLGIEELIGTPLLTIKVVCLECSEIRILDGYGKDKKNRATKITKIMESVLEEATINNKQDVLNLLPKEIGLFTASELAKIIGLKSRKIYSAVHALENLELIKKAGKQKRSQLWEKINI